MEQTTIPGIPEKEPYSPSFTERGGGQRLTAKQKAFVRFYLESYQLEASAIKAGYSPKSAGSIASRLIKKSQVTELIQSLQETALKAAGVTAQKILMEAAALAYSDVRNLFNADGSLKNPAEWDDCTAAAISSVEVTEQYESTGKRKVAVGYLKKVKLWDKNSALEKLGKFKKLWVEKVEVSGKMDLSDLSDEELNRRMEEVLRLMQRANLPENQQC